VRRWLQGWRGWFVVVIGLALLAIAAFVVWPRPGGITEENWRRAELGMNRSEVEAILGPPGDHRTGPTLFDPELLPGTVIPGNVPRLTGDYTATWAGDSGNLTVLFDSAGHARSWAFAPTRKGSQSLLGDFLWRAKRLWRRWFPE
jgi:hypothetical protein